MNEGLFQFTEKQAAGLAGLVLVGLWAFFEASFWFIAPDFILIILAFTLPRRWLALSLAALGGSLAGGIVYYGLLYASFDTFEKILKATPFVMPRMLEFVESMYRHYGYAGVLVQSLSFMSFKIWTYKAVVHDFHPLLYFPLVMISPRRTMMLQW